MDVGSRDEPSGDASGGDAQLDRSTVTADIQREARIVGLGDVELPSLEAVERRRIQLWSLAVVLLAVLAAGVALFSAAPAIEGLRFVSPLVLRLSVLALTIAFCVYALEKESHLRRLSKLLLNERMLTVALTNRVHELGVLLEAGRAVNAVLHLDGVLEIILRNARELLKADGGSIMLTQDDELVAATVANNDEAKGRRERIGSGIAGMVAGQQEPMLISGQWTSGRTLQSAMSVPLLHRGELLGVLNLNGAPSRRFNEYDLRALSVFAEQAATAIANARLYEARGSQIERLRELDRARAEFLASVSHDLRTPLTTILGAAATLRLAPVGEESRRDLLAGIERQAKRLEHMVGSLLDAAALERGAETPSLDDVDVASLARSVVAHLEVSHGHVQIEAPDECHARADPQGLARVLDNLLDNAFKHGSPPYRLQVCRDGERVRIGVLDAGKGVPRHSRDAIFHSFSRLSPGSSPGLGLGLAIVRRMIEACGGSVWVEDAPGGGAAFWLSLPAAAGPA